MNLTLYSDLELLVIQDMLANGYDFANIDAVKQYWKERLE